MSCRERATICSLGDGFVWQQERIDNDSVSTFRAYLSRKLSCLYFIIGDSR